MAAKVYNDFYYAQPLQIPMPSFPPPCNYMTDVKFWSYMTKEEVGSDLWLLLPASITVQEQVKAYTWLSYLAEVGGYVGRLF